MYASIQEMGDGLYQQWPDAAVTFRENVGAQQEHGARFGFRERLAHAGTVAAYQVGLQRRKLIGSNTNVRQFAEAGIDSVGRGIVGEYRLDDTARSFHTFTRSGIKRYRCSVLRDCGDVFETERVSRKKQGTYGCHTYCILRGQITGQSEGNGARGRLSDAGAG